MTKRGSVEKRRTRRNERTSAPRAKANGARGSGASNEIRGKSAKNGIASKSRESDPLELDARSLLPAMIEAARAGGKVLKKYWVRSEALRRAPSVDSERALKKDLHVEEKSGDAGLVTIADFESERACVRALRKAFPGDAFGFLTEEGTTLSPSAIGAASALSMSAGTARTRKRTTAKLPSKTLAESVARPGDAPPSTGTRPTATRRWILDPLDGTTNFVHGFPMFCVSLGAEVNGRVVAAVIYHPILDDLYTAAVGGRAEINGAPLRVSRTSKLTNSLFSTGFTTRKGQHLADEMAAFEAVSKAARAVRRPGSAALDLAYVARGVFDGFWERRLSPWDVAAGGLLVQMAGGSVTDFSGNDFRVDQPSILATNGALHPAILPLLKD